MSVEAQGSREVSGNGGGIIWHLKDMLYLPGGGGEKQYMSLNGVIPSGISMLYFFINVQARCVGNWLYRGNLLLGYSNLIKTSVSK